ncbi:MAG: molybdopterin converting factor [Chloroflexi bacterium]|nr:molybdopterin converting factor [Chloroflexota bacterium]
MNKIHVLFFASLKDRAGQAKVDLELPDCATVSDLKELVIQRFPAVAPLIGHALVSVNQNYAFDGDIIPEDAEVALFPPVSGGSENAGSDGDAFPTVLRVVYDPLDLDDLIRQITLPTTGAACVFTGMVRGITRRGGVHETSSLEYEAYVPMAEAKMAQVAREIRERWPSVEGIAIVQRIGRLEAGTPTVLIACTASHRDTGVFDAARYGIDRLKEIVPIWKKEIGPGGEVWIEGDYHPQQGD